jgi:penicillin-binding protein 1C
VTRWGIALVLVVGLAAGVLALDRAFPPNLSRLAQSGSEILDRNGRTLALLPAPGGVWRFRTSADDVSPEFLDLLLTVEDRHFYQHPGVNPLSLARAAIQWARAGKIVSGGSTLTMQAVRLLEPRPRTLRSKAIEILRALQLEAHMSKREILGVWLTLAPFGGNLEGVRAGSLAWFGVPPAQLDPAEAALLVAIPRRPEALRPDRHPGRARALRDRVLAVYEPAAIGAPVPTHRLPMPRHAPQIVAALPPAPRIPTTLDLPLQAALERLADAQLAALPERVSMALLIADARTREVRAIYGGAWGQERRAGALDLTRAVRSPGSALKPFIYALAFQDGITSPDAWLSDLPRHYGGYAPENFDRGFAGRVTAGEALRRSLNLPAVALLDRIGPTRYAAALRAAGVPIRLPPGVEPSLPLALGGGGITLREIAALYAGLATDGAIARLRLAESEPFPRHPFVEPAFARMVGDVLTQPFPGGGRPGIAWKTGTSWGGRDAWAVGFDAAHVAAVWIGRPDGTPLPGATGRALAVPLLARLFDILPSAPRHAPRDPPRPRTATATAAPSDLRLLFPPPGAVLSQGDVVIRAMGGRRPFAFLVDGEKLPAEPFGRETRWTPPSAGFYRLTVLDADGEAARSAVSVK